MVLANHICYGYDFDIIIDFTTAHRGTREFVYSTIYTMVIRHFDRYQCLSHDEDRLHDMDAIHWLDCNWFGYLFCVWHSK